MGDGRELTNTRAARILIGFVGLHVALSLFQTILGLHVSSDTTLSFWEQIGERATVFVFHLVSMPTLVLGLPLLAIFLLVALPRKM